MQGLARQVLSLEDKILEYFSEVHRLKINGMRIRIHGDYHLGQVLVVRGDVVVTDFEGEPGLTFSERRLKRNPLKDVANDAPTYAHSRKYYWQSIQYSLRRFETWADMATYAAYLFRSYMKLWNDGT